MTKQHTIGTFWAASFGFWFLTWIMMEMVYGAVPGLYVARFVLLHVYTP